MKNLKINKDFNKILKNVSVVLITTTIGLSMSGCCNENHIEEIENLNNKISKINNNLESRDKEIKKLKEINEDLKSKLSTPTPTLEPTKNDNSKKISDFLDDVPPLKEDTSYIDLSIYDSISDKYYMKYYSSYHGGPDSNGNDDNGYVQEITKNGKKYLVDANDFNQVLIAGYDTIGEPFYMKYYSSYHGGPDSNGNNDDGYVQEIIKNGKKYLVDANDFELILASNYSKIYQIGKKIVVEYKDGSKKVYNNNEFTGEKSNVLKKVKK